MFSYAPMICAEEQLELVCVQMIFPAPFALPVVAELVSIP